MICIVCIIWVRSYIHSIENSLENLRALRVLFLVPFPGILYVMHTIIKRSDAAAAGLKFFYSGTPCAQGHDAQRYTSTGNCVACHKARGQHVGADIRKARVARLRGHFNYPLHVDDHAAALAYCQALDMARGIAPTMPTQAAPMQPRTQEQLAEDRRRIFGLAADMTRPEVDPLAHGWK